MMGYGWGMGLTGWMFMGLFWMALLGLAVWAVIALTSRSRPTQPGRWEPTRQTPLDILDRRLAGGELTVEQYRQVREELAAHDPGHGAR